MCRKSTVNSYRLISITDLDSDSRGTGRPVAEEEEAEVTRGHSFKRAGR